MTQDNEGNDALGLKLNLLKNFRKQSVNNGLDLTADEWWVI